MLSDEDLDHVFALMGAQLRGPKGTNRKAACPLAPYTHPSGHDNDPSLSTKAGEVSYFKCWSCKEQGTVKHLARRYAQLAGDELPLRYVESVEGVTSNWEGVARTKYGDYYRRLKAGAPGDKPKTVKKVTEEELKAWMKQIPQYAVQRGMTMAQIDQFEIGFDPKENRMIIPIRDVKGKLLGVSGRALLAEQKPKYKHYFGLRKEEVLYGEQFLNQQVNHCYLVEGFADVWTLSRLGVKNVFAVMGTSISTQQLRFIHKHFVSVSVLPDLDDAGPGLAFVEEAAILMTQHGIVASVCGVQPNPIFEDRGRLIRKRDPVDYRLIGLDSLRGKDPGSWNQEDLDLALRTKVFFTLKNRVIVLE